MDAHVSDAGWKTEGWEEGKKSGTYVIFRHAEPREMKPNKFRSDKEGRPVYDDVILIEKIVPGDPLNRPVRPIRERDKEEYPEQWARFQQKMVQQVPGTPLSALTWMSRTQVAEFNALHVQTVEQLAELPDSVAQRFMGFATIREKAIRFISASKDNAAGDKMASELKKRDEEIEALKAQMAEFLASQPAKQSTLGLPKGAKA